MNFKFVLFATESDINAKKYNCADVGVDKGQLTDRTKQHKK